MKVDTGVSAISEETYKETRDCKQVLTLTCSRPRLRMYTGESTPLALEVDIVDNSQGARARLLVVKGSGPRLLV